MDSLSFELHSIGPLCMHKCEKPVNNMQGGTMRRPVLLVVAVETKRQAVSYIKEALLAHELAVTIIDISLGSNGQVWDGERKLSAMDQSVADALSQIGEFTEGHEPVVLGVGGGTGSDMIIRVMKALPNKVSRVLVTTLPFDPRAAVAEDSIILVPSIVDIEGLNPSLRNVFDKTASLVAGLAHLAQSSNPRPSVGLTTLGITSKAGIEISKKLNDAGHEVTAFHANGFGGAAFAKYAREGAFVAAIDMTVHEITRMVVAGTCIEMPDRFSATGEIPRIILPGGMNVIGLGSIDSIAPHFLDRPYYRHSAHFTHVKMSAEEMHNAASQLAAALNSGQAPTKVLLPMGGFSSEDRPDGAIEDADLREVAAQSLEASAQRYEVVRTSAHIFAPETANKAVHLLLEIL
ncbi:Tm-1-like ATP-binding domain-containing protein [Alphaproteobacteria bacterium LSUCC0396]|jgi:uncharacterized protein (UPF0261 family)